MVDTNAPTLTLTSPTTPSNNTSPTFTGTASDTTTVTVSIYKGSTVGGSSFTTASAVPVAGAWTSGAPVRALPEGTYSAVAKQPSSIGNQAGVSPSVKFVVDTKAPALSINQLSHQQFKTFPELSGTAGKEGGDLPTVLVKIYKGSVPGGQVAIEKSVAASGGAWSFASSTNLVDGPYTAVATESDEAGNVATSAPVTFTLDIEPPALSLEGPAQQQSNNTEPSFSGTTSDPTPITVDVYLLESGGKKRLYATAGATPAGGTWKSGALSQPLGQGHHTYTATATQTDEAGNTASAGPTPPFVVDTQAPTVTLDPPRSPTNNTTPSFSGIASERTTVTIRIYNAGSGQLAAQTSAAGTGSSWTSGAATPALADGRYWVVASQESAFGNHAGETERTPLTVDTVSPHVTLEPPSSGSGTSEQVRGSADASDPDGYPTV
ncbi:MAG: hypothetical protein E6G39_17000, partial [Actinobacteria bacterium]